jgi:hypothetical protein
VLRALKQVLRPGGRIGYTTIYIAPGLATADRKRARQSGPIAVGSRSTQTRLLVSAGFAAVAEHDLTPEFAVTARTWLEASETRAAELAPLEPPGAFDQRQRDRRSQLDAIDDGLLRRGLLVARRPGEGDARGRVIAPTVSPF